jgi:integrase
MTRKRTTAARRKRTWPNVYKRVHRRGQVSYVVDLGLIGLQRKRRSFKTKAEADTFAELKRTERTNHGTAALSLSDAIRVDAVKANTLLSPHGVSMKEAAQYYVDHVVAYRQAPTVSQIVERLIADAERNDRRPRTILDLKTRLRAFAEDFPDRRLSELTVEELKDWMEEGTGWSVRTRINYLTKLSQLFNYALRHNWVEVNLAERLDRPSAGETEPQIFTVEQARQLLEQAGRFHLLPYIALGLFAGLRSAELMRLAGGEVNFEARAIVVGSQVAKKRSRRVVEMYDALHAWLSPLQPLDGPIVDPRTFRLNMEQLRTAAGIAGWPHNGLRHSFGSYHLALHGDAVRTAQQMGHRSTDVVHNHYKVLVLKSEAEKYWALRPRLRNRSIRRQHPFQKRQQPKPRCSLPLGARGETGAHRAATGVPRRHT